MQSLQPKSLLRLPAAILVASIATAAAHAKDASLLVTAPMRANAVANAGKHPWARDLQSSAVSAANRWMAMSDEDLSALVTSQELPRASEATAGVFYEKKRPGCPKCGEKILLFGGAWKRDPQGKPWKLQCPSCGEIFPKNDFAAFYATALDEHGMFRRGRGDRSLLVSAEHPERNDPLRDVYVDDGYGMRDPQGNVYHVIAYYNNAARWQDVLQAVAALARAFTYTDDVRYAHKAAVLLDRVADVYPAMDYTPLHRLGFQHSQGGSGRGRIVGCIAECFVAKELARAYDSIYDGIVRDPNLLAYDRAKAARYRTGPRQSAAEICRHIEDHLLLEILRSCKDQRIAGNLGMTHTAAAVAAIALDRPGETQRWLDWLFDPTFPGWGGPGGVPWVLVQGLDADGMGGECGSYGLIWSRSFIELAELLAACPRYNRYDMPARFPKLKQCFLIESRLLCLDAVVPPSGDSGATGVWGRPGDAARFAQGFDLYNDPRLAELAWRYAGADVRRLRRPVDIFARDSALADRIAAAGSVLQPPRLKCEHLGRYGQAVLQTARPENGRAVWIHYGYGKGHSHADALNLGLYAKNVDMLPDLGYPAFTGAFPERLAWTSNTASHNTLLIGDAGSRPTPGGKISLFVDVPPLRAIDVAASAAYAAASLYRRQVALVDVGDQDSYVLDVFRAAGGANHRLSWHGPASSAALSGVALVRQQKGTFAGPDAEPRQLDGPHAAAYQASGFTFLYDVERSRAAVAPGWTADWKAEDLRGRIAKGSEPHLRLHGLTSCDELALASGDPPQNKSGNPRSLRYLIASRLGPNRSSQFVTLLEPYDRKPFIRQVRPLKHSCDPLAVAAVAVDLADGDTDVLIVCREPLRVTVEGGIEFDGLVGLVRFSSGRVKLIRTAHARSLKAPGATLSCPTPAYQGKVTRIDAANAADQRIFLSPPLPPGADLVGRTIHFENKIPWDTSFDITAQAGDSISTGEISLVRGFKIPSDFQSGHQYTVNPGDNYVLPVAAELNKP